jgi:hypothetical protein
MAPAAQAQGYWYSCWNGSHGYWDYCWWDGGVSQEADQDSEAGEITQTFNIS